MQGNKIDSDEILEHGECLVHDSFIETHFEWEEEVSEYYDVYVVKYKEVYYYIKTESNCCVECKQLN